MKFPFRVSRLLVVLVLGMACGLVACKSSGRVSVPVTAESLVHHRYEVVTMNGKPLQLQQDAPSEISFGENLVITGKACNRFRGEGRLAGNVLMVPNAIATRMFCAEEDLNKLESILFAMFNTGATITIVDNGLVLSDSDNSVEFIRRDLAQ